MMRAADGVLAFLVALSIALSAALWTQQPQFRELPTAVTPPAARSPARDPASFTRPVLLLHFPGDRHIAISPTQPHYDYAWEAVATALRTVRFERLADAPVPSAEELAARRQDLAVEFTLSGSVPIHEWMETWGHRRSAASGDGPGVTRVLLSLQEPTAAVVWTGSGPRLVRTVTSATLRDRLGMLGTITAPTPWRSLPDQVGDVRVADGIYVPDVTSLPAFTAPPPDRAARDPGQTAARFFLDLSVVRTITEHDDALLFTDGQSGLRVYPWGGVEYQRAHGRMPSAEGVSLRTALERTAQYVQGRDEWPREAYVASASRSAGQRTLRFGQRLGGWPVFAPTPALEVMLDGTTVVRYSRNAVPVGAARGDIRIVSPEQAIAAAAEVAAWRSVTAVELGYVRPDTARPEPAPDDMLPADPLADGPPLAEPPRDDPAMYPLGANPPASEWPGADLPNDSAAAPSMYIPVWRLTLTGGLQVFVDAVTGQLAGGGAR